MTDTQNEFYRRWFWRALIGLVIFRIVVLIFATPNLGPDETQYWFWAQTPDFGYFSKPPLIAWLIAISTTIFGDSTWAIRLPAVLCHAGTAIFLFLLANHKFGTQIAFYTGIGWFTLPGVALSSTFIATDAPMLLCWSAALYYFSALIDQEQPTSQLNIAGLGIAVGAGLLAKYAMVYFPIGIFLCALFLPSIRTHWKSLLGTITIAVFVFSPNIFWNLANDFSTLSHTSANANWSSENLFSVLNLGEFIVGQVGIAGPIITILLIIAVYNLWQQENIDSSQQLKPLLFFIIPPLFIVCIQAFISRAHANWAAAAYPAAILIATIWTIQHKKVRWLKISLAIHLIALGIFAIAIVNPVFADTVGFAGTFKRLRGWDTHGTEISAIASHHKITTIMADDREIIGGLVYYVKEPVAFIAWNSNHKIDHHFEAFHQFNADIEMPILYITTYADAFDLQGKFSAVENLGESVADLGRGRTRTLYIFKISDYQN